MRHYSEYLYHCSSSGYYYHQDIFHCKTFINEVKRACRSYYSNEALSRLEITNVAIAHNFSRYANYSVTEIIQQAGKYAYPFSDLYNIYYENYFGRITPAKQAEAVRAIALRDAINICVNIISHTSYLDKLALDCLRAYLGIAPSSSYITRREGYQLLKKGFAVLGFQLATYFIPVDEQFKEVTDVLRPIEVQETKPIKISKQEQAVLECAAKGVSGSKALARHLGVSVHTIETYWKRIRWKLDAKNRTEALVKAYQMGLVSQ